MTLALAIVDTDLTTVLANLNGVDEGSSTGFKVRHFDLGQVTPQSEFISNPSFPGAVQSVIRYPPVEMELSLQAYSTSWDALRNLVGGLVPLLREGGIMRYKFTGQTNFRYIEFFGAQLPQLIRGEDDTTEAYIIRRFQDKLGFPMVIPRQPAVFETTKTVVTAQQINNDNTSDQMSLLATVGGDLPALAKINVQVAASGAEVTQLRIGRRSGIELLEYRENYVRYPITSPASLSTTWKSIHRQVLTPTTTAALEGAYRVFVALKLESEDVYRVQLAWSMVDAEPAGAMNEEVILDSADTQAMTQFADIDLGTVRFDRSGSALALDIRARADAGGTIAWSDVWLEPIDEESLVVYAPGFKFGRFAKEVYTGNELTRGGGAGLDDDDRAVLADTNEYCETADTSLPVGIHIAHFIGTVINHSKIRQEVGKFEVLENGSVSDQRRVKLTSRRKHTRIHYDMENPKQVVWRVTSTADDYRWKVTQTVSNSSSRAIKVNKLIHSFIPVVGNGRQIVIDGIERECYIADSAGARYFPAHLVGPFMTLEPGDNILVFRMGDVSTRPVMREADARTRLAEYIPGRIGSVTIQVRERFIV